MQACEVNNILLEVALGDIVREPSEVIVNAANESLMHGAGVAGAISMAGGSQVDSESRNYVKKFGRVATGTVGVTGPGRIPVRCIVHAVGPIYRGRQIDSDLLYSAAFNSFLKTHELGLSSVSIPAISSGIFGFPKDRCAVVMISAALDFAEIIGSEFVKRIRFSNFDMMTTNLFNKEMKKLSAGEFRKFEPTFLMVNNWGEFTIHERQRSRSPEREVEQLPKLTNNMSLQDRPSN